MAQKKKYKSPAMKIEIDWEYWTDARIANELVQDGHICSPSEELRNVLFSMTTEEVHQHVPKKCWYMTSIIQGNQTMTRNQYTKKNKTRSKAGAEARRNHKQLKDLSAKVREMLANEKITKALLKDTPKYVLAATEDGDPQPADVIICVLIAKSFQGDVRAIEQLRKMGYGDTVTLEAGESFFNKERLKLDIVDPTPMQAIEAEVVEAQPPALSDAIQPSESKPAEAVTIEKPKIVITKEKNKNE